MTPEQTYLSHCRNIRSRLQDLHCELKISKAGAAKRRTVAQITMPLLVEELNRYLNWMLKAPPVLGASVSLKLTTQERSNRLRSSKRAPKVKFYVDGHDIGRRLDPSSLGCVIDQLSEYIRGIEKQGCR